MNRLSLIFLIALPLLAADDLPVKLDGGNTIQLCGDCTSREIRASVTATNFTSKKDKTPQITEVSLNGVREKAWTNWFHASWEPAKGKPASLVISVSDDLKKTGTYNLVLLLRPDLPKLTLQIVQPAAQLETPEKLLITRTQYLPLICCNPNSFSFDVRESSGAASITDLGFFNRQATQGNDSVSGTLALKEPARIIAGRAATVHYELRGDYPLGIATGSLKLIAPQLAQPIALPYEVHTKLHAFYLVLAIVLGLALSYYARTRLQKRIQLSQARLQADEILQEIADCGRNYDERVRNAVEHGEHGSAELRAAVTTENVETITQRAAELRTAWVTAITDFNIRIASATEDFGELQSLLVLEWLVPTPCAAALLEAKAPVANAKDALQRRNADEAQAAITNARQQFANTLHNTGRTWQNDARGLADTMGQATAGVPESVRAQFATIIQQAPPELNRVTNEPIATDTASLRRALEDLQTELASFSNLLVRLAASLRSEWKAIEGDWQATPGIPHPEPFGILTTDFLALVGEVQTAAVNPRPLLESLPDRLARLQQEWRDTIVRQVPANHPSLPRLQEQIANRNFRVSVRAMSAIIQSAEPPWGDVRGPAARAAAGEAAEPPEQRHVTTIFSYGGTAPQSPIPGLPRVRILQSLLQAQLLQTGIVGALTALWAFTSYSQSWDGTWTGLLAPLLGAFLLDVSVEGLKNQIQQKRA
jgi:hypothetical protein